MFFGFVLFFTVLLAFSAETAETPTVKEVGGEYYAYMEFTGPYNNMGPQINKFMAEFLSQKLTPAGPTVSMYFNSPTEVKPEELKWAYGFIVAPESNPKEPLKKMELKKQTAVVCLHKGPYDSLSKSHEIAWKYVKDKGYKVIYPYYEKYLNNPKDVTPDKLETLIVLPVEKK